MVYEPLRKEPAEKTLHNPMVKVELNHAVIDTLGRLEDNRSDWRLLTPLEFAFVV